jgi:archaellum component FlaG (FlaF/FlaG flagellin family)
MSGNEGVGIGDEVMKTLKIKAKGSVTIPSTSTDKTALLKAQNVTIAEFTVKPSNNNEGITLEDIAFKVTKNSNVLTGDSDIRVKIGGIEADFSGYVATTPGADAVKAGIQS